MSVYSICNECNEKTSGKFAFLGLSVAGGEQAVGLEWFNWSKKKAGFSNEWKIIGFRKKCQRW